MGQTSLFTRIPTKIRTNNAYQSQALNAKNLTFLSFQPSSSNAFSTSFADLKNFCETVLPRSFLTISVKAYNSDFFYDLSFFLNAFLRLKNLTAQTNSSLVNSPYIISAIRRNNVGPQNTRRRQNTNQSSHSTPLNVHAKTVPKIYLWHYSH